MIRRCPATVQWADLDLTGHCIRPDGHSGPHLDGCWQWDAYGMRVPREDDRRDRAERAAGEITGRTG